MSSETWWDQRQREQQLDRSHNKKHARLRAEKQQSQQQRPERRATPIDVANFPHADIAYLVQLTGVDCVRLHGSPERELRNTAQRVHAKLKQIECSRYNKGVNKS